MKRHIITWIGLFLAGSLAAQSYNTVAGMRFGTDWGISVKQRVYDRITAELIFQSSLQREETNITLLGAVHKPLITRRLNFFYGGGLHKGWFSSTEDYSVKDPFGIDLVAGLDFTIAKLNISYDYKPAINIVGGEKRIYSQTGVTLRYVIAKHDKYSWEMNQKQRARAKRKKARRR